MKKIIGFLCAALFTACSTPKGSVDGFQMKNGQICGNGTVTITTPTQAQADSAIAAVTKNLVTVTHLKDSANVHVYIWELCSPVIKTTK